MIRPKVGFVTCVHPFYNLPAIMKHRDQAVDGLTAAGCDVISAEIPRDSLDAVEIAALLKKNDVDMLLLFFCTWVAEDIPLAVARELSSTPLLIWALPYLDKDIPMPSPITGLTTTGSNISRLGKSFAHMIGHVTPEKLEEALGAAKVAATLKAVSKARFGMVGYTCPGMVDAGSDAGEMQRAVGATAVHMDLDALLKATKEAPVEEASKLAKELISKVSGLEGVTEEKVTEQFRMYLGMKALVEKFRLDAFCVRCWPELRDDYKNTICLTHCQMAQEGIPSVCEIDLPALITAYVLNKIAGTASYSFDITAYLEEDRALQFAHCGSADLSLAADPKKAVLRGHMRTGAGAMLEFGFKEGKVTIAKLLRPIDGKVKMFVGRGNVIPTGAEIRGSVATVQVEPSPDAFIDKMLHEGVEHHVVVVYGDYMREMAQFCKFAGMELITP